MTSKKTGFTLAELLIALAITGVIAAIALPQIITKAQAHKRGMTLAKTINNIELGCQTLIQNENSTSGNTSQIDKLMLVDDWKNKILPYVGAKEIVANQTAWSTLIMSPVYAAYYAGAEEKIKNSTQQMNNNTNSMFNKGAGYLQPEGGDASFKEGLVDTNDDGSGGGGGGGGSTGSGSSYDSGIDSGSDIGHKENTFIDTVKDRVDIGGSDSLKEFLVPDEPNAGHNDPKPPETMTPAFPFFPDRPIPRPNPDEPENPEQTEPTNPIFPVFPVRPTPTPDSGADDTTYGTLKQNSEYKFTKSSANFTVTELNNTTADKYKTNAKAFTMVIDTNGNSRPNNLGKDQFTFYLNNSCKMIPVDDGFTKQYVQNGFK